MLSTFLDPRHNQRADSYGGNLGGRARLLLEIVEGLRARLPSSAVVAVKLDARDGAELELVDLAGRLAGAGIDLIEISGGSYERPLMAGYEEGGEVLEATEHESPFWSAAAEVSAAVDVPVMLTGGFRTRAEVDEALAAGVCDVVGVGRPLAYDPSLAGRFVQGETDELARPGPRLRAPGPLANVIGPAAGTGWHRLQLARTGNGAGPKPSIPALLAAADYMMVDFAQAAISYRSRMRLAAETSAPRRAEGDGR